MSRFDYMDDEGSVPWDLWLQTLSRSLGGKRGQEALAEMEEALVALPEPRLIDGSLADDGQVCAVGAYVAYRQAKADGEDLEKVIRALGSGDGDIFSTADAGKRAGLAWSVAWHLAYLNDEQFAASTPERRYERMLAWVRRAQGKEPIGEPVS